jgi:hypothetical protein
MQFICHIARTLACSSNLQSGTCVTGLARTFQGKDAWVPGEMCQVWGEGGEVSSGSWPLSTSGQGFRKSAFEQWCSDLTFEIHL